MGIQNFSFDSALLKCTLEHLPDPVFVKNREYKWIYLNQAFCTFVGFSREEMLGKTDYDFFPHDLAHVFRQGDKFVFENKKSVRNVERFIDLKGKIKLSPPKKLMLSIIKVIRFL